MTTPTNPYYTRAFNALAGALARARQMINEFALIQRGFDLIGNIQLHTKYQLACSDLTSDLEAEAFAGYFRAQRALELVEVRASVAEASASGPVEVDITVNGSPLLTGYLSIDQGEKTSTTATSGVTLAITSIPDDSEFIVSIINGGAGAKGLIVSVIGRIGA